MRPADRWALWLVLHDADADPTGHPLTREWLCLLFPVWSARTARASDSEYEKRTRRSPVRLPEDVGR